MATAVGLEIAQAGLRAAVVEGAREELRLTASHDLPCDPASPEALTAALTQLRRLVPGQPTLVVGIPSTAAILTTVRPLVVNPMRAALAIQFELQQHLPFELREAAWHYQWLTNGGPTEGRRAVSRFAPRRLPGRKSSRLPVEPTGTGAVVAAMRRSLLDERLGCLRRAGLTARAVAVSPLAILNLWSWARARRPEIAQRAGSASPVALLRWLGAEAAEWILWRASQVQVVQVVNPAVQPGATGVGPGDHQFLQELAGAWEALTSSDEPAPGAIWMVGPAADPPRLRQALSERVGIPVEAFEPDQVVGLGAKRPESPAGLACAIGLALQGLGRAAVSLNLLAELSREATARQIRAAAYGACGVCAAVAIGLGVSGMVEVRRRRLQVLETLIAEERQYQKLRPDLRVILRSQQRLTRRRDQLLRLIAQRSVLTELLAKIANAMPETIWLTKIEYTKTDQVSGLLEGRARSFQDVTHFLDRLKSDAGLVTVKPRSTEIVVDETSGREQVVFAVEVARPLKPEAEPAQNREDPDEDGA